MSAPAQPSVAMLRAEDVHKDFGGLKVLDGITFAVQRGERRALIGPNGAGKSTFLNILSGLTPAAAGRIWYQDRDVTGLTSYERARLGIGRTFQVASLFDERTVEENLVLSVLSSRGHTLALWRPLHRYRGVMDVVDEATDTWDLGAIRHTQVNRLSYGDRRRLEILMSALGKPQVMLLDEPAAGLSAQESTEMINTVSRLDPDLTIVMVEHDMDLVFSVCTRITVLAEGHILAEGAPEDIADNPAVVEAYLGMRL